MMLFVLGKVQINVLLTKRDRLMCLGSPSLVFLTMKRRDTEGEERIMSPQTLSALLCPGRYSINSIYKQICNTERVVKYMNVSKRYMMVNFSPQCNSGYDTFQ